MTDRKPCAQTVPAINVSGACFRAHTGDPGAVVDHREGDDERAGRAASAVVAHQIRVELQFLPDALLHRRTEWAEQVALRSGRLLAASGNYQREPFDSGTLRRIQTGRGRDDHPYRTTPAAEPA